MFVALVRFPTVPAERDGEFVDWFNWSNGALRETSGLRQRRLLRGSDGSYSAVVEHESAETFAAMHNTDQARLAQARLAEILDEHPQATTFEVAADLEASGSCCTDTGNPTATPSDQRSADEADRSLAVVGGCCAQH